MPSDLTGRIRSRLGSTSLAVRIGQRVYARYLGLVAGDRGLRWRVNGETCRIDPRVRRFIPHENERALFHFLRSELRPGQIVFDIGAFLGTYAVFEARWVGPTGRVVAVEPTPASCTAIRRHLRMNDVAERVTVIEAAVGAEPGPAMLEEWAEPYRNQLVAADGPAARRVRMITIDGLCGELGLIPDWIRMDVQGSEFDVLRGARRTLEASRGRLRVVVEMHPQIWARSGFDVEAARRRLRDLGLTAVGIETPDDPFGQDAHAVVTRAP